MGIGRTGTGVGESQPRCESMATTSGEMELHCRRCQGLMVREYCADMKDMSEARWLPVWRCINCGDRCWQGVP